jgi:hypothetical protein
VNEPEVLDLELLIQEHVPELIPSVDSQDRSVHYSWALSLGGLYGAMSWLTFGWPVGIVVGLLCSSLGELTARAVGQRRMRQFRRSLTRTPWVLYGEVADRFRRKIEMQRRRALGPDSTWQRARQPLLEASAEAQRAVAYWRERSKQEDGEVVRTQLHTAQRLAEKFSEALGELDRRSEVLQRFFHDCEAKLAVLERGRRDVEESRRLADLSERAEEVVEDASRVLGSVARDVLSEAVRVGRALGAMERLGIKDSAGDLPLDRIESVADRILESAAQEHRALDELADQLTR